jgi:ferric iron reductase protein FhuF
MRHEVMSPIEPSPVVEIYDALRAPNASWNVEIATPARRGQGWIAGTDLRSASTGPFHDLLSRIGDRAKTADRRTIAASFALRFGWASAMAIAPYLRYECVPDIALDNVSFKFRESTFLERTAMHEPRGIVVAADPRAAHPSIRNVPDHPALLQALRAALIDQATPVVDALYEWSGFAPRGTWGMLTSSWASHFTSFCENRHDQRSIQPTIDAFFAGTDIVADMQPLMHSVTWRDETHLFQRRASCCRYYLLPRGDLCASCPLVSQEERLARNLAWMKTQSERQAQSQGHA